LEDCLVISDWMIGYLLDDRRIVDDGVPIANHPSPDQSPNRESLNNQAITQSRNPPIT